jgi:hypothetical protein
MGTSYTMDGRISIDPPLNYAQIQEAKKVAMGLLRPGFDQKHAKEDTVFEGYMPLKLDLVDEHKSTPEGVLHVIRATGLVPSHQEGSLSYTMQDLVWKLATHFGDHTFGGVVTAVHEDVVSAYKLTCSGRDSEGTLKVDTAKGAVYVHWDDQSDQTKVSDLL